MKYYQYKNNTYSDWDPNTDNHITFATSRDQKHSWTGSNDHKFAFNFDTDPTKFYYDDVNGVSNVTYITDAAQAKLDAQEVTGTLADRIRIPGNTCVVRFVNNDNGQVIESMGSDSTKVIDKGTSISRPAEDPVRTGYTFDGWYADKACTQEYVFGQEIYVTTTIYAKWIPNEYTLTLNANGGTLNGASTITIEHGKTLADYSINNPTPPNVNQTFVGWYTDPQGNTPFTGEFTGNTTLYAKYSTAYTLTFDATSAGSTYDSITVGEGQVVGELPTPSKAGYQFVGWFTAQNGGEQITDTYRLTGNVTAYARWAQEFTITFDTGDGSTVDPITNVEGTSIEKPTDPKLSGYKFVGWYDSSDNLIAWPYTLTGNITMYAKWEEVSGEQYIADNDTGGSYKDGNTIHNGDVFSMTLGGGAASVTTGGSIATATDGETFASALLPGGGSRTYTISAKSNATFTIYYTIYNGDYIKVTDSTKGGILQDGSANTLVENQQHYNNVAYMYEVSLQSGQSITITANTNRLIIFAVYAETTSSGGGGETPTPTTYTVTYNINGHGDQPNAVSGVTALPQTLPTLSENGWTFGGWYTDQNLTQTAVAGSTINADTTLYAKWTQNSGGETPTGTVTFFNANNLADVGNYNATGIVQSDEYISLSTTNVFTSLVSTSIGDYTKALVHGSNKKAITITATQACTVSVYFMLGDGKDIKSDGTYTVNSGSAQTASSTEINVVTLALAAGESLTITITNRRIWLCGITYTI